MRTTVQQGPVAQWITHLTTDQKILGSTPGWLGKLGFSFIFLGTFFKRILKQFLKSFECIFVEVILHLLSVECERDFRSIRRPSWKCSSFHHFLNLRKEIGWKRPLEGGGVLNQTLKKNKRKKISWQYLLHQYFFLLGRVLTHRGLPCTALSSHGY